MKNGYDQFFKNARQAADQGSSVKFQKKSTAPRLNLDLSAEEDIEQQMRRRAGIKPKRKKPKASFPWKMVMFSAVGLGAAVWGFQNYEQVDRIIHSVEVNMMGSAMAQNQAPAAAPAAPAREVAAAPVEKKASDMSSEEIDHLTKLNDRKKELDAREEELNRMESELAVQKVELEKRMKELEEMRSKISTVLDDRVKADEGKIDTLVQMYTNMKAPQAAKIFETMDEDLAVELLGRMKKKNAADIMNLLKPEKAQVFSEKYAGYKRR
ncbi:hypothetical protein D3C87_108890 [compost metagenome]